MRWGSPTSFGDPIGGLGSIACPSVTLCVAGSDDGVLVSTDPTGGAGAWHLVEEPPGPPRPKRVISGPSGPTPPLLTEPPVPPAALPPEWAPAVYGVSCPTSAFCVAVEGAAILTSSDPAGGTDAWKTIRLGLSPEDFLSGVSCASQSMCVAYEKTRYGIMAGGRVMTSANPAGGAGAWHTATLSYVPDSVSCVRPNLCLLGTRSGTVLSSRDPQRGADAWRAVKVWGERTPRREDDVPMVTCASTRYCLAGPLEAHDLTVLVRSSNPTGTAKYSWPQVGYGFYPTRRRRRGALLDAGSCTQSGFCSLVGAVITASGKELPGRVFTSPGYGRPWANSVIGGELSGVSCVSSQFCVAVGSTFHRGPFGRMAYGELVTGQG